MALVTPLVKLLAWAAVIVTVRRTLPTRSRFSTLVRVMPEMSICGVAVVILFSGSATLSELMRSVSVPSPPS
ncbi:hypothetical protein D3C80_2133300 [compost metagenome]